MSIITLKQLLLEASREQTVKSAIRKNRIIKFYYSTEDNIADGFRIVEPYVLGYMKGSNNIVLRAWLLGGKSGTPDGDKNSRDELKKMPGWRMFRLDRMKNVQYVVGGESIDGGGVKKTFDSSESFIKQNRPKYNPNDKDMSSYIYQLQPTPDTQTNSNILSENYLKDFYKKINT